MIDQAFDDESTDDACSVLVPVDGTIPGVLQSMQGGGADLPEDPSAQWSATVTYKIGDRTHLNNTHRVYESIKDGNTGRDPSSPENQYNAAAVPTWWIDIGPTNKFALFDGLVSSQTSSPSPLVIKLTPGSFNGFALFGLDADSYSVEVRDRPNGAIIFAEYNVSLDGTDPADYYEYFFSRFKAKRQVIKTGIEPYSTSEITLSLYRGSENVKIGMFAIGDLRPVGIPQRDASVEPQDFSYVKQDAFGNTTVQRRANATGMSISTMMYKDDAGAVLETLREVLGTPVVVVGSRAENFEWLTVFGLVSGRLTPAKYPYVTLSINVKGLI
jgi:hypothetical protein